MGRLAVFGVFIAIQVFAGHDLALTAIVEPDTVASGYCLGPRVVVQNVGSIPETGIPIGFCLDSAGVRIHIWGWTFNRTLAPGESDTFWLDNVALGEQKFCYLDFTGFTYLAGDENRANDTLRRRFWWSSAFISDTLEANETGEPEVNGIIEPEEYYVGNDISDFFGRAGRPRPRASCLLYSGWSGMAWFALDIRALRTREDRDRVIIYVDEDRDLVWEPDSSEGMYVAFVSNGMDSIVYCAMPDSVLMPCPGCTSASSVASGNLQFELGIPNGERKSDIRVPWHGGEAGAAVSFWRGDSCWAWWPQSLELVQWQNPASYGVVWWIWLGLEEGDLPSPCRLGPTSDMFVNSLLVLHEHKPALLVDITGRKAMDLQPGENDVRHLAPGVYFLKAEGGRMKDVTARTAKIVVQR